MKKARNGFVKNLRYLCLIGVVALGLMTVVGTGGNDDDSAPSVKVTLHGDCSGISISIEGCAWTTSTSNMSNIQYDNLGRRISFDWSLTIDDGNCSGETYSVFVYDISYNNIGCVVGGKYDYEGETYDIQIEE